MIAGRRGFLGAALAIAGAGVAALGLRRSGLLGGLRRGASDRLRPTLDASSPPGPLAPDALATLLAFTEVVVAGAPLSADGREAVRAALAEQAETRPGFRALCVSSAAWLDALAGGRFAEVSSAARTALVAEHRLGEHPAGRLELLWKPRAALALRDLLVPALLTAYWDSPAGWREVGYARPFGVCGDGREYTRRPA